MERLAYMKFEIVQPESTPQEQLIKVWLSYYDGNKTVALMASKENVSQVLLRLGETGLCRSHGIDPIFGIETSAAIGGRVIKLDEP
jgi:hypothetical protein